MVKSAFVFQQGLMHRHSIFFHTPSTCQMTSFIKTRPLKQTEYVMHTPTGWCKYLYTYIQPTCPSACISLDGTPGIFSSCTCPSRSCLHFYTCILHFLWCFFWRILHKTAVMQMKENTEKQSHQGEVHLRLHWIFLNDTCAWMTTFLILELITVSSHII